MTDFWHNVTMNFVISSAITEFGMCTKIQNEDVQIL
jgi:hypothetical protein